MDEDLKTLRRREDSLFISGTAVLLFSLWDGVRFVLAIIMNPDMLKNFLGNMGIEADEMLTGEVVTLVIIGAILLGAILIRLLIFLGARSESKGEKGGWIYVILAFLVLAFLVADQIDSFADFFTKLNIILQGGEVKDEMSGMDTAAASTLLNITSAFALLDIIISSFTVKKIRKKLNLKDGEVK